MTIRHGDPAKFWSRVDRSLLWWESKGSPARWRLWRDVFWGREGVYVLVRCGLLTGALAMAGATNWGTSAGGALRVAAIALATLFLFDIMIVHVSIAFVSRKPASLLRSAVLSTFSFFQIPLGFAVFYLCNADSFNSALTWRRAVYFSIVTATTLGYGDISPKPEASWAQLLVMVELAVSVTFLGVLIARLIALTTVPGQQGPGGLKGRS
ncbi:MAG: two pore domain potassium channel family protein [Candidatus Tectomicrobia bacterium]|uniref:Two pore domain potassium channel family protein n=1 Tax=Tectimicrobiota bacterium TaxID=2528274 RepID=A0A932ZVP3_UNCTE|nr:two pore domain potassium channel family protein [Candidatus Tectomicrobia bacterium]MBI4252468.1 two pore domain potassium channel family protein [Candidatus Tectomicrobia bacterium]